jgi:oligoendopeptidase F
MNREFLPKDLKIETWDSVAPFFNDLKNRKIESADNLKTWLKNKSELDSVLEEDLAWRYIKMNCNTEDEALSAHFEKFITEIEPKITEVNFELNKLLNDNPYKKNLEGKAYEIMLRSVKNEIDLFRKENIPIQAEIQKEEQEYGKIAAAMTINYGGEEITLQKAANYLKETDRKIREEVYKLIWNRRLKDKDALNDLMGRLITKRQKLAKNADFENFRDYMFKN